MKRTVVLTAMVILLLLSGIDLQTGSSAVTQSSGRDPLAWYTVEQVTTSGGGYHLTNLVWHVNGAACGGSYCLNSANPGLRGNGCCCSYLPCVLRNFQ